MDPPRPSHTGPPSTSWFDPKIFRFYGFTLDDAGEIGEKLKKSPVIQKTEKWIYGLDITYVYCYDKQGPGYANNQ